jgi:hypothetical protein
MLGFHAVTLWQNETFHFLYHMNIIIQTHFNSRMGKMEAKTTTEYRGGLLPCESNGVCVCLSSSFWRFVVLAFRRFGVSAFWRER